ncbi:MAG: DUF1801 domain-containing protein [Bacteroidota bacterium]
MENAKKIEAYYAKAAPFKEGINKLRQIALSSTAKETYKWSMPVYTVDGKNVFGICRFKNHFGVWFFNGTFMEDPLKVLTNAQEGKTKAMRHWKFFSEDDIATDAVSQYMEDAIQKQLDGKVQAVEKQGQHTLPSSLKAALVQNPTLDHAFEQLSIFKRNEFCEYIESAKQEKTKKTRLDKIIPLIEAGIGLNDKYR